VKPPVKFAKYNEVFFDLDGVILDTNSIKRGNIGHAVEFMGDAFREEFVAYFTANNGLPRETKINKYFLDKSDRQRVLETYNRLNAENLHTASPLPGAVELIQHLHSTSTPIHVFTGGSEDESRALLKKQGLTEFFSGIHGGPRTKRENFDLHHHDHPIVMFGDSRSDYDFATSKGIDFVFVHGYTQFSEWQEFFATRSIIAAIPDFTAFRSVKTPS
jgi:phosphoglycolate phosphatase-like HAD superfamily hydrolase